MQDSAQERLQERRRDWSPGAYLVSCQLTAQDSPDHFSGDTAKKPHRSYKRVDFTLSQRMQKR